MNRFERISRVNGAIIIINIIIFLLPDVFSFLTDKEWIYENGAVIPVLVVEYGEYYRLITSVFLHFSIRHLLNNMLVLFILGDRLEQILGGVRYLLFYLLCGLGANIVSLIFDLKMGDWYTMSAGASGAIFGVVGGLMWIVFMNRGRLGDLSSGQLAVMAFFTLYLGFTSSGVDNAAHVGGLLVGILLGIPFYVWVSRKKYTDIIK